MNILIDFTQIPLQKVGVGIYALNLLRTIYEVDSKNHYFVLCQDDEGELSFIKKDNFTLLKVNSKIFRMFISRILLEQIIIPLISIKNRIDIIHMLHYSFPIFLFSKCIVTIHDMTLIKFPKHHMFTRRHYYRVFIWLSSKLIKNIITISFSTKEDFAILFNVEKSRISVIYPGVIGFYREKLNEEKILSVRKKYHINNDYILYLGTIEPRKNIKSIISAYSRLIQNSFPYHLVIAGKKGWYFKEVFDLVDKLNLGAEITFTGFVEEDDKSFLISGAKIFIYPSLYEGFGIPVLESLACGIPTITSNTSSLPEVAGDAAILIDPKNLDEIYNNLRNLAIDFKLYSSLKQKSVIQAAKFSWEKAALETIAVYNSQECR